MQCLAVKTNLGETMDPLQIVRLNLSISCTANWPTSSGTSSPPTTRLPIRPQLYGKKSRKNKMKQQNFNFGIVILKLNVIFYTLNGHINTQHFVQHNNLCL